MPPSPPNDTLLRGKFSIPRLNGLSYSTDKPLLPRLSTRQMRVLGIIATILVTVLIYGVFFTRRYPPYYSHYPRVRGSPFLTDPNEDNDARGGGQTGVIFNYHTPIEINSPTIQHFDLNTIMSTTGAAQRHERVLVLTPLRDAVRYLPKYFELLGKIKLSTLADGSCLSRQ